MCDIIKFVDKSTNWRTDMDINRFLTFYQSFNRILKDIKRLETTYMREYGLRSVHMGCILRIKESEKGMTVTELARATGTDKALISRILKELIEDGFVLTRTKGEDKAYKKKYYLTEKSEKIATDINNDIAAYVIAARGDTPEEDIQTFYRVLESFEKNIALIADNK